MSYRRGFILAFSGLLALAGSAGSAHAQMVKTDPYRGDDRYVYRDDRMYKDGVYADDDFWYGEPPQNRVTNSRYRTYDRNRDGVIERNEWSGSTSSFRSADWNNDGVLSGREVRANAQRVRNSSHRVDAVDRNRDGVIAQSEWLGNRNEFRRLDRNRDGYITYSEARMRYAY